MLFAEDEYEKYLGLGSLICVLLAARFFQRSWQFAFATQALYRWLNEGGFSMLARLTPLQGMLSLQLPCSIYSGLRRKFLIDVPEGVRIPSLGDETQLSVECLVKQQFAWFGDSRGSNYFLESGSGNCCAAKPTHVILFLEQRLYGWPMGVSGASAQFLAQFTGINQAGPTNSAGLTFKRVLRI